MWRSFVILMGLTGTGWVLTASAQPANVLILNTPCYNWSFGCFGTGSGMFMAYWDRNGFPDLYTGPTNGGEAPLTYAEPPYGTVNPGIRSMWASEAGFDGRHATNWGHYDNYGGKHATYQSTAPDPYTVAGRPDHAPDSIGDFIGLNQNKWTNLNDECNGNIDAYAFNFFDTSGAKRINFTPPKYEGEPIRDIQSGLRAYARYCGYEGDSFSQLTEVWPDTPPGTGFTFDDLRREIDAGRPLLLFLQENNYARANGYNPDIHAFYAVGYEVTANGDRRVRVRDGWTHNANSYRVVNWYATPFYTVGSVQLYVRGVIGLTLKAQVTHASISGQTAIVEWTGPQGLVTNTVTGEHWSPHWHVVEASDSLEAGSAFVPVSTAAPNHHITFDLASGYPSRFYRLRRMEPVYISDPLLHAAVTAALPVKEGPIHLLYDVELEKITDLVSVDAGIESLAGLEYAKNLTLLDLRDNAIADLSPLVANQASGGIGTGTHIDVSGNPLSAYSVTNQIPLLESAGVVITH